MGTLYESIKGLCDEHGIKPGRMCVELGISKSLMTKLHDDPRKTIQIDTAQKIADYFGVSVDRVLGVEKKEKPAVQKDDELDAYLERLRTRPECRMLFKLADNATKEDVEKAVAIIEALRKVDKD